MNGSKKLRILVFSTSYFPFVGGAEVAIREVARKLKDKFDFFIVTSRFDKKLPKIEKVPEGTIVRLGFGNILDKYLLMPLGFFWALRRNGILFGLDISAGSMIPAVIKLFFPRRFFVLNIQYGYGDERLKKGRWGLMNLGFRIMLSQADFVTAISNHLLDITKHYGYTGYSLLIPDGVDLHDIKNTKNKVINTIVTGSRLVLKNGIDIVIRAVAEVKKTIPNVKCLVIGEGPEEVDLKNLSNNLKLEENVKFVGVIPSSKVFELLRESSLFVRPSRSEGMGIAFLEGLAAGIPIIGTLVGGIPDIIEDGKTGLFCKSEDHKDLAEKILILLRDESLARRIVENGQKMIKERFLWDGIASKYENLFNLALAPKILIATGIFPPDIGGPATYSKILLDELPKHRVNINVLSFGSVRHLPKIIRHFAYFLRVFGLGRRADIIFAQDPFSVGFPAAIASKILRKKFILKVVGDYAWEQWQQGHKGQSARGDFVTPDGFQNEKFDFMTELRRKIQKFVARQAKLIITPSNYLKKIVGTWGINKDNIHVISNAFEPPRFENLDFKKETKNKLNLSGKVIISAGRLVPWKGFGVLIEVFTDLAKDFKDLKLIIIGDGREEKKLKLMTKDYGLSTRVVFTGSLSRDKVLEYLQAADVFALNTAYEGFSHQILEAMALGVPVVTTNIGGNPEIIRNGENGFLVDFNDKEALKNKIAELLNNKNLAESFSEKSKITALQFTKEKMIIETIKILQSL